MASWEIGIDSSSGQSTLSLFAICSGLHEAAQRRSWRRPCRRPCQGALGPGTRVPSAAVIMPASPSCTYRRSSSCAASFATFGLFDFRSTCHWAVVARYSSPPLRVAAFRRSSHEIVDGERLIRRAMPRIPQCWACKTVDFFSLCKRQIAPQQWGQTTRRHASTFAEPSRADRLGYAGRHRPIFTRQAAGDRPPEPTPMLTASRGGTTRRPHRRTSRTM